ncbi:MAG: hypothetical protein ACSHX9_16630 [Luteolibacter sp.]
MIYIHMLRFLTFALFASALAPAAPYGISVPLGENAEISPEITSIRYFASWEELQPTPGTWNMQPADDLIASAKKSGTEVFGIFHQPTDDESPALIGNKEAWRTYVATLASRYVESVTHWEVIPSYSLTNRTPDAPYHYAQLLTIARETALDSNPNALIGFSLPNYDLEFLDRSLRDGAEGQFDYISLAPFPVASGTDPQFLSILPAIREILTEYGMDEETPVHIALTGTPQDIEHYARLARENGYAQILLETTPATFTKIDPETTLPTSDPQTETTSYHATFGETLSYQGLYHLVPDSLTYDATLKATRMAISARPPITRAAFLAPTYTQKNRKVEITIKAKRLPSETNTEHPTGFGITYESIHGIRNHKIWWTVPGGDDWQTHTWTISDADFTGKYAWNFRMDASGAGNDLLLKEVTLKPVSD